MTDTKKQPCCDCAAELKRVRAGINREAKHLSDAYTYQNEEDGDEPFRRHLSHLRKLTSRPADQPGPGDKPEWTKYTDDKKVPRVRADWFGVDLHVYQKDRSEDYKWAWWGGDLYTKRDNDLFLYDTAEEACVAAGDFARVCIAQRELGL